MEFKVTSQKQNPLFKRKEILGVISHPVSPSYKEMLEAFSLEFKVPQEQLNILSIKGKFGTNDFLFSLDIYDTLEAKNQYEIKTKKQRKLEKSQVISASKSEE